MDYQQEYFDFLDDLKESGRTNIFGDAPYQNPTYFVMSLQEHFGISELEAKNTLLDWMNARS